MDPRRWQVAFFRAKALLQKNATLRAHSASERGQTAIETAFVLTMILFVTFMIVNYAIVVHTKMVATYAAFMAGRSYQVFGDQQGAAHFGEIAAEGKSQQLIEDLGKTVTAFRVAEDIFTCGLPWVQVPEGDAETQLTPEQQRENRFGRCLEGKRKYEKTNIGKALTFAPFKQDDSSSLSRDQKLDDVAGSFTESGRAPLRYGILSLKYRVPLMFNPMGVFSESGESEPLVRDEVFVPVLLNPGLSDGLKKAENNEKDFDDDK